MKKIVKRALALCLALTLVLGMSLTAIAAEKKFPDVKAGAWYEGSINKLVTMGGIDGNPDGKFYPNNSISNAEFIKIVVAITIGEQAKGASHWADNYMAQAAENKLITTADFAGKWDKAMTRNDMAKVMAAALEFVLKEEVLNPTEYDAYLKNFSDYDSLCTSCKPAIANAYAKGIVTGNPDKSFGGANTATRAEACAMLVRLVDKSERVTSNRALTPEELKKLEEEKENGNVIPDSKWQSNDLGCFNPNKKLYYATASELPLAVDAYKDGNTWQVNSVRVTSTHVVVNFTVKGGYMSSLAMVEGGTYRSRSGVLMEKVNVSGDTFDVKYQIQGDSIEMGSQGKTDITKVKYFAVTISNYIIAIENPQYGGK